MSYKLANINPVVYVERDGGYVDDEQVYPDLNHMFSSSMCKMFFRLMEKAQVMYSMQDMVEDGFETTTTINIENECKQFNGDILPFDYRKHKMSYDLIVTDSIFISKLIEKLYSNEFFVEIEDEQLLDTYNAVILCNEINSYIQRENYIDPSDITGCKAVLSYNPAYTLTTDSIERSFTRNLSICIRSLLNLLPHLDYSNRHAVEYAVVLTICKAFDANFQLAIDLASDEQSVTIAEYGFTLPLNLFNLPSIVEIGESFRQILFQQDEMMYTQLLELRDMILPNNNLMYCAEGMVSRVMEKAVEGEIHPHNNMRYVFYLKYLQPKCVGLDFESDIIWSWCSIENIYAFTTLYNVSEEGVLAFDRDEIVVKIVRFLSSLGIRSIVHMEVHGTVLFIHYIDL